MLVTMAVGIYTSRVVLATLGVSDYGIYNVVGGFVGMFAMISASMAASVQRFLSHEIGKKKKVISLRFYQCRTNSLGAGSSYFADS